MVSDAARPLSFTDTDCSTLLDVIRHLYRRSNTATAYLCIVGFPCLLHFCIPVIAFPNYYCIFSVFVFCIFHALKIVLHLPVLQFYLSPFLPARRCASAGTIVTVLRLCLLCLSQVGVLSKWMNGSKWGFLSWSLFFKQSYTVL